MIEPAPGLFSITTGCFIASDRYWPTCRENTSAGPPAPNGTTILIGFVGYSCAGADAGQASANAGNKASARNGMFIGVPPHFPYDCRDL